MTIQSRTPAPASRAGCASQRRRQPEQQAEQDADGGQPSRLFDRPVQVSGPALAQGLGERLADAGGPGVRELIGRLPGPGRVRLGDRQQGLAVEPQHVLSPAFRDGNGRRLNFAVPGQNAQRVGEAQVGEVRAVLGVAVARAVDQEQEAVVELDHGARRGQRWCGRGLPRGGRRAEQGDALRPGGADDPGRHQQSRPEPAATPPHSRQPSRDAM